MIESRAQLSVHFDHQDGVSTQVEKVIVSSDPFHLQDLLPDARDDLLYFISWFDVCVRLRPICGIRCGQNIAIDFAVSRQW